MDCTEVWRNSHTYMILQSLHIHRETLAAAEDSSTVARLLRQEPADDTRESTATDARVAKPLLPPTRKLKPGWENSATYKLLCGDE
jgi:hypothetical protein